MSSRPSSLLVSRDLKSYPTLYVAILIVCDVHTNTEWLFSQDHYAFCYEVLADFVEKMETYHNFKTLM